MSLHILGIVGSLRAGSLNRSLLQAALSHLSEDTTSVAELGEVPLYNGDLDGDDKPVGAQRFIDAVQSADALVIATPEYNYSIPGVLKNAIDWASRPSYRSPLANKPTAILGASMSFVGTARAQAHLKEVLSGTVTPIYPHPEFLVGEAHKKFSDGALVDASTSEHLQRFMLGFRKWAEQQRAFAG